MSFNVKYKFEKYEIHKKIMFICCVLGPNWIQAFFRLLSLYFVVGLLFSHKHILEAKKKFFLII